jgi:hypothetical protein
MGFGCAGSNPDRHIYVFGFVRDCYVLLFLQKKERGGFYGRRRVGNDFGFNTELGSVFAFVIYSFIEEILKPDPRKKTRKSSASADTDPDEPEQKMDYSGEGQQQRTLDPTNQQLTRWFMDTLRNDNNRTDDENRRDNVVAIRDVLAYSSQLELTDAVGAEVQEPDPETLEVANVLLSFRANRIEVIHRGR